MYSLHSVAPAVPLVSTSTVKQQSSASPARASRLSSGKITAPLKLADRSYVRSAQSRGRRSRLVPAATGTDEEHWMDFMKFDGQPSFDVIEKTKEYQAAVSENVGQQDLYLADDYVFRGSVIGPITAKDVRDTQKDFNITGAYPDLKIERFGYTADPENPYRCLWFERYTGTATGELKAAGQTIPPTGKRVKAPVHAMSVTWNPEGKVVYSCLSPPLDRFEGNTKGQGAVFALLSGAGLPVSSLVGDPALIFQQKVNMGLGAFLGKAWSFESDIPKWWKSKARGAEVNDM